MRNETVAGLVSSSVLALLWVVVPSPWLPIALPATAIAAVVALKKPFWILILFAIVSAYRLHELAPALIPLRIPLALGALGLFTLLWYLLFSREIQPCFPPELKVLLAYALAVTAGLIFARSRELAFSFWVDTFLKLVVMTVALSWVVRTVSEFRTARFLIAGSGMLIAAVAIYNRLQGIALIEGTRTTVGRAVGSPLGDPNILALTLLAPLSFCLSLVLSRESARSALMGASGAALISGAILCTQSRGGLLGVFALLALTASYVIRSRILLLLVAAVLALGLYFSVSDRFSGEAGDRSAESSSSRLSTWQAALNMALARPLTGVGLNNFESEFYFFKPSGFEGNFTAHNTLLQVAGESGFLGGAIFIAMMVLAFVSLRKSSGILAFTRAPPEMRAFAWALRTALVGYCVAGLFLSQAYSWSLYLLIGLTAAVGRWSQEWAVHRGRVGRHEAPIAIQEFARREHELVDCI